MPFVTAEIWQALPGHEGEDLATMPWPEERPDCIRPEDAARMEFVQGVIVAVRTIKAELDIAPSHKVVLKLHPADKPQEDLLLSNASTIQTLARLETMEVGMEVHAPKASASSVVQGCEIIVPLKGNVDLQGELARLAKEMGKIATHWLSWTRSSPMKALFPAPSRKLSSANGIELRNLRTIWASWKS